MHFWAWFPFSLVSLLCFGFSSAFAKMPGVKGHSRHANIFWQYVAGSVLAIAFFWSRWGEIDTRTLLLGALWGSCIAILNMFQMYGLTHIDTHTLFPVGTTGSLIVTILAGLSFFNESLSWQQAAGIGLTVFAVYSFLYQRGSFRFQRIMLAVLPVIILLSAFGKIVQKIGVDEGDIGVFLIVGYGSGAAVALLIMFFVEGRRVKDEIFSSAMRWGILNGALGFAGSWAIMTALERGPFTLITSIHSMYIFAAALIAHFFLGEQLRRKTVGLIALSIVAVVLMRMH